MRRLTKQRNRRSIFRHSHARRLSHAVWCAVFIVASAFSTGALVAVEAAYDTDTDRRLSEAGAHFAREKEADTWWYYGWLGFSSAILATSTTLYATTEDHTRVHKAQPISMVVSGLGVTTMILFKPKSFAAQAELTAMPENTAEEKAAKLKKSEAWLKISAERQRFTTGLFAQLGTVTLLLTASLVDAIWFNGPWFGLLRFVTSMTVAELKIFSQPTFSRDLYDSRNKTQPTAWHLRMLPGEIALVMYF